MGWLVPFFAVFYPPPPALCLIFIYCWRETGRRRTCTWEFWTGPFALFAARNPLGIDCSKKNKFRILFSFQFAKLLGCVLSLEISVTGITIIALGTSMPDTFASRSAAVQDDTADASIGNITGISFSLCLAASVGLFLFHFVCLFNKFFSPVNIGLFFVWFLCCLCSDVGIWPEMIG